MSEMDHLQLDEDKENKEFIHEALWKIIARHDRLIESTNTKAALIIAFNTFIFGGIILKWKEIIPDRSQYPCLACLGMVLLSLSVLLSIASLLWVIGSIKPFQKSNTDSILFFKTIGAKDADKYKKEVKEMSRDSLNEDLAEQIHILSGGISQKFDRLNKATWLSVIQLIILLLFFLIKMIEYMP